MNSVLTQKEQILQNIKSLYNQLGYPPKEKEYDTTYKIKSRTLVKKCFTTWPMAIKEAGIQAHFTGRMLTSKEELDFKLNRFINEYGYLPVLNDFEKNNLPEYPFLVFYQNTKNYQKNHPNVKFKTNISNVPVNNGKYEEAVLEYQDLKRKLSRVPFRYELSKRALKAISKEYYSYIDFVKAQGDKPLAQSKGNNRISDKQLIKDLQTLYRKLGYPPHASDYERSATVRNHFGSWQNALKSAGIKATFDSKNSRVTKEEVIFKIKKYIQAHGRIPMYNEYKNMGISYMTIQHYFGSNENAANYFKVLTFNQKISSQKIKIIKEGIQTLINTNKEINIANLSKVINLSIDKIRNDLETYFRQNNVRSKSIDKFCIAIGIDLDKYNWHLVLLEYDNFKKKHHRIPNVTQLSSVSYAKILQKYDSYRDFCIAIGDGDEYLREKYDLLTNEQLLFDLKVVANRLGRTPTIKDYCKCKKINRQATYIRRFGSWTNALSEAGLKLKDSQKNLIKHQEKMSNE